MFNFLQNVGVLVALWGIFLGFYLFFTEVNTTSATDFSRVLFRVGGRSPRPSGDSHDSDDEKSFVQDEDTPYGRRNRSRLQKTTIARNKAPVKGDVFSWRNVRYSVSTSEGQRTLLDNVAGYVAPGKLTALMGESGAGKV